MASMRVCVVTAVVLVTLSVPGAARAQTAGLTVGLLQNATYPSEFTVGKQVTLRDGRYDQRAALNDPFRPALITFVDAVIGTEYAAVVIASNTGGSGVFLSLHPVTSSAGAVTAGPGLFLGDRQRIEGFAIVDGRVRLALLTQGPGEPFCCPTQRETREFVRDANAFRLVSTVVTQPGALPAAPSPPKTGTLGSLGGSSGGTAAAFTLAAVALVLAARRRTAPAARR